MRPVARSPLRVWLTARWLDPRPGFWWALAVGGGCWLACTGLTVLLQPYLGPTAFAAYYISVPVAAALGGFEAGVVAWLGAGLVLWGVYLPAERHFHQSVFTQILSMTVFMTELGLEGLVAGLLRAAVVRLKAAENAQRLLAEDLDHRVKNSLATVQAIARQTLKADASPEAMAAFERRLKNLSAAHDILSKKKWDNTDMAELVREQLLAYLAEDHRNITIMGPPVALRPEVGLSLAIILYELTTNAARYGALTSSAGELSVSWRLDEAAGALTLDWLERGGPAVAPPTSRGFGLRLLERGLVGETRLDFAPAGLQVGMTIPHARRPDRPELGAVGGLMRLAIRSMR